MSKSAMSVLVARERSGEEGGENKTIGILVERMDLTQGA